MISETFGEKRSEKLYTYFHRKELIPGKLKNVMDISTLRQTEIPEMTENVREKNRTSSRCTWHYRRGGVE